MACMVDPRVCFSKESVSTKNRTCETLWVGIGRNHSYSWMETSHRKWGNNSEQWRPGMPGMMIVPTECRDLMPKDLGQEVPEKLRGLPMEVQWGEVLVFLGGAGGWAYLDLEMSWWSYSQPVIITRTGISNQDWWSYSYQDWWSYSQPVKLPRTYCISLVCPWGLVTLILHPI